MKKLFAVLVFLAIPALAQTGDCTAETGTSTSWEVLSYSPPIVRIEYTFHAAGLLGQSTITRVSRVADGTDLSVWADSQCEGVDSSRVEDERQAGFEQLFQNTDPELVQPAFPEPCAATYPDPANPSGLTVTETCRLSEFHQWLVRMVWPENALVVVDHFQQTFNWLEDPAPQGGAGFNTNERRDWLAVDVGQWSDVNSRMSNLRAIEAALMLDPQWQGDLDP